MYLAQIPDKYSGNFGEWIAMAFIASACIMLPFITVLGFRRWLFTSATYAKGVMFIIAYLCSLAVGITMTIILPYQDMHPLTEHGIIYMSAMVTGLSLYVAIRMAVLVFKEQYDPQLVPLQAIFKARSTHKPMPRSHIQRRKEPLFDNIRQPQIRSMPATVIEHLDPSVSPDALPRELRFTVTPKKPTPVVTPPSVTMTPPAPPVQPITPTPSIRKPARRGRHAA